MELEVNSLKILLVEDEAPKSTHIATFLKSICPSVSIHLARSVNSACNFLENEHSDLVILDMSLPTFDVCDRETGGRPQGFGGIEVLRFMTMEEIFAQP